MSSSALIRLTVELTPDQAAGLLRLADKISFREAMATLYPHVDPEVRCEQVSHILQACDRVQRALSKAGVGAWPWIDTGCALVNPSSDQKD